MRSPRQTARPIPNSNCRLTNRFCPLTSQLSGQQRSEPMNPSPEFQPPTLAASYLRFLSAKNNVGIWVRRYAYREDLSSRQICRLLALRLLPRGSPNCQRQFLSRASHDAPRHLSQMAPRGAPICFIWPLPRFFPLGFPPICFRWPFRGFHHCHRWPFGSSRWFRSKAAMRSS